MCSLVFLSSLAHAGSVVIGSSADTVTFSAGAISLGTCTPDCVINGSTVISADTLNWSLSTPADVTVLYSGFFSLFAITEDSNTLFTLSDSKKNPDVVDGNVVFTSATQDGLGDTDLFGTLTFTEVSLPNKGVVDYVNKHFGFIPGPGDTAIFDLTVNCGGNCIQISDPTGSVTGASISSLAPEPGSLLLIASGLAAVLYRARRRSA